MFNGKPISELNMEDLKQMLTAGIQAEQYAWDHYEELAAREAAYTLYGPFEYRIGAAEPGPIVSKSSRKLTFKTKRKKYLIYELDNDYKLLRVRHVFDPRSDTIYHCFELNGIQYACPFMHNRKEIQRNNIVAIGYKDGKPFFCGYLSEGRVLAEFYEYISAEKVRVIVYSYHPFSKYSVHGYPMDPNAPLGEPNSPAQRSCREEKPMYTDFSKFFKEEEEQEEETNTIPPISDWIDSILNTDIPDDVKAFCFNLYEEGNGSWSMELVCVGRFDPEDEDWPCDEVTDFGSRNNSYKWEMEVSWKEALAYAVKELKTYLKSGKYAELLKSKNGVGVGFVDGNIEIIVNQGTVL